jgi:hypothetical protein
VYSDRSARQFLTIHAGHVDVGKQDRYVLVSTKNIQRIGTIGGNHGIVTEPLDKLGGYLKNVFIASIGAVSP